jgi:hypothetical protein
MLRLWIGRKNVGRLEVMVTYADGRGGGRPTDPDLDAFEITIFEAGTAVDTVTLNSRDSIDRIGRWLADANRRLPLADQQRAAREAAIPISQLADAWLDGDERACVLLADRLSTAALLCLATSGLAACSQFTTSARAEIAEVVRVGTSPQLWSEAHKAFDRVRGLTLAAERQGASPEDARYVLLFVAENAARVIYNASLPRDPFDDDAAESLLRVLANFCGRVTRDQREEIINVVKSCLAGSQ